MLEKYRERVQRQSMFCIPSSPDRKKSAIGRVYDRFQRKDAPPLKDASECLDSEVKEPIADIGLSTTLPSVEIRRNKHHKDLELELVPGTVSLPITPEGFEILKKKFELCSFICDFSDKGADLKAKEVKKAVLTELDSLFNNKSALEKWPIDVWDSFYEMVNKNVFRALPRTDKKYLVYQDSPAITEVYWPHLELVYSLLLKYQMANVKFRGFDKQYCRKLITNYSAPDGAEREVVAKLLALYISAHKSELQDYLDENAVLPFL